MGELSMVGMIPTRQKIGQQQAVMVGKSTADRLIAGWGLRNAKRIVAEARKAIKAEILRRGKMRKSAEVGDGKRREKK
jgi:hypothetical protein